MQVASRLNASWPRTGSPCTGSEKSLIRTWPMRLSVGNGPAKRRPLTRVQNVLAWNWRQACIAVCPGDTSTGVHVAMVCITFPDRETEKKALGFLLGRFSGRVLKSGEHLVPEAALEALADQNIAFAVEGKATYEQQLAALRGAAATPVQ